MFTFQNRLQTIDGANELHWVVSANHSLAGCERKGLYNARKVNATCQSGVVVVQGAEREPWRRNARLPKALPQVMFVLSRSGRIDRVVT